MKEMNYQKQVVNLFLCCSQAHDEGEYFPIWGTCLGFQLLTVLVAGENLLSKTTAENVTYPLNFSSGTCTYCSLKAHLHYSNSNHKDIVLKIIIKYKSRVHTTTVTITAQRNCIVEITFRIFFSS